VPDGGLSTRALETEATMRLRSALVLSLALGVSFVALGATTAQASPRTGVSIAGQVSNASLGLTLSVQAQANGTAASLSGQGMDNSVSGGKGYCRVPLTGSLSAGWVTLSGNITFSNDPANLGVPVTYLANSATGEIIFDFGGFVFTGTGQVHVQG